MRQSRDLEHTDSALEKARALGEAATDKLGPALERASHAAMERSNADSAEARAVGTATEAPPSDDDDDPSRDSEE